MKGNRIGKRVCIALCSILILQSMFINVPLVNAVAEHDGEVMEKHAQDQEILDETEEDGTDISEDELGAEEQNESDQSETEAGDTEEENLELEDIDEVIAVQEVEEELESDDLTDNLGTVTINFGDDRDMISGTGYTVNDGMITLTDDYDYVLTGTTNCYDIKVSNAVKRVTLQSITMSDRRKPEGSTIRSKISLVAGRTDELTLYIRGENQLTDGSAAGIEVPGSARIRIKGENGVQEDKLNVLVGRSTNPKVAIGSGRYTESFSGHMIIEDVQVTADGGGSSSYPQGVGIGSYGDMNGEIIIRNSVVKAYGYGGAGIGAGYGGVLNGAITVEGGSQVYGESGTGAGVGSGESAGMAGNSCIQVADSELEVYSHSGTGIGAGRNGAISETSEIKIARSEVMARGSVGIGSSGRGDMNGTIEITDCEQVTARSQGGGSVSDIYSAAIGSGGYITSGNKIGGTVRGIIHVTGSDVFANGDNYECFGIGGYHVAAEAQIILKQSRLESSRSGSIGGVLGMDGDVNVEACVIRSTGGSVGIGSSGYQSYMRGNITLQDCGEVRLQVSRAGVGIGGINVNNSRILIKDCNVEVSGGYTGIGGAYFLSESNIQIEGGVLQLASMENGSAIGGGGYTIMIGISLLYGRIADSSVVISNGAEVTAASGDMAGNAIGAGYGAEMDGFTVSVHPDSTIRAYAATEGYYGIRADALTGGAQIINAHLTDGTKRSKVLNLDGYISESSIVNMNRDPDIELELPAKTTAFAFTVGGSSEKYMRMQLTEEGEEQSIDVLNGDAADPENSAGYGPHSAGWRTELFRTASTVQTWPVMLESPLVGLYDVSVSYYYFDEDGNEVEWEGSSYMLTDLEATDQFSIETGAEHIPVNYVPWYYTINNEDTKYYYDSAEAGRNLTTDQFIYIKVYMVSSLIDVAIPAGGFFWYVSEDTAVDWQGRYRDDPEFDSSRVSHYEIRSAAYKMKNLSETDFKVTLKDYNYGARNDRIQDYTKGMTLNLTGDLREGSIGADIAMGELSEWWNAGTYSELFRGGETWTYGFEGIFPRAALPDKSVAADCWLDLQFEVDLSGEQGE